eukprot:gene2299-7459_t
MGGLVWTDIFPALPALVQRLQRGVEQDLEELADLLGKLIGVSVSGMTMPPLREIAPLQDLRTSVGDGIS